MKTESKKAVHQDKPIVIEPVATPPVVIAPEPAPAPVVIPAEVRLEAVEVPAEVKPEFKPVLTESIDSLAKIVDKDPIVEVEKKGGPSMYLWLTLAFLLGFACGVGAGFGVWGKGILGGKPSSTVVAEPTPTAIKTVVSPAVSPTIAVVPDLDKTVLKLEVLNGNGGKGVAGVAKDFLLAAGYKNVETGNADTQDFTVTELAVKNSKSSYTAGLRKDLAAKYTLEEKTTVLSESNEFDAIVTIGAK